MGFKIEPSRREGIVFDVTVMHPCGHVSTFTRNTEKLAQSCGQFQETRLCTQCAEWHTTKVRVRLVAECDVEIEVRHRSDEDPRSLSDGEEQSAIDRGDSFPRWEVHRVETVI